MGRGVAEFSQVPRGDENICSPCLQQSFSISNIEARVQVVIYKIEVKIITSGENYPAISAWFSCESRVVKGFLGKRSSLVAWKHHTYPGYWILWRVSGALQRYCFDLNLAALPAVSYPLDNKWCNIRTHSPISASLKFRQRDRDSMRLPGVMQFRVQHIYAPCSVLARINELDSNN